MIEYILLLLAVPIGLFAKNLTKDEKQIYRKYFQFVIPLIFILAVTFAFLEKITFLTLTFMFLMLLTWNR
jgi:hypothetical protein